MKLVFIGHFDDPIFTRYESIDDAYFAHLDAFYQFVAAIAFNETTVCSKIGYFFTGLWS